MINFSNPYFKLARKSKALSKKKAELVQQKTKTKTTITELKENNDHLTITSKIKIKELKKELKQKLLQNKNFAIQVKKLTTKLDKIHLESITK